jgi:Ice-binding-like
MSGIDGRSRYSAWLMVSLLAVLTAACGDSLLGNSGSGSGANSGPGRAGAAPALGAAAPFGGFGGNAGMTNQGLFTVITGAQGQPVSVGTTGASTLITGFHDTAGCDYNETGLNVGRVDGTINTAAPPPVGTSLPICTTTEGNGTTAAIALAAANAALAAFTDLAGRPGATDPGANLGGLTLAPGIYATASGAFLITGSDLTLDAGGNANAVWVFQMANSLTVGAAGAPRSVILAGGAQPKNVFWQVGSAATINGAGGGTMVGTIISSAATTFSTPGNAVITTLNGRALALNASVTLVNTVINVPAP